MVQFLYLTKIFIKNNIRLYQPHVIARSDSDVAIRIPYRHGRCGAKHRKKRIPMPSLKVTPLGFHQGVCFIL